MNRVEIDVRIVRDVARRGDRGPWVGTGAHHHGGKKKEVSFFDFVIWGDDPQLRKGDAVVIEGRLKQSAWTGKDSVAHSRVEIIVESVTKPEQAAAPEKKAFTPPFAGAVPAHPAREHSVAPAPAREVSEQDPISDLDVPF